MPRWIANSFYIFDEMNQPEPQGSIQVNHNLSLERNSRNGYLFIIFNPICIKLEDIKSASLDEIFGFCFWITFMLYLEWKIIF